MGITRKDRTPWVLVPAMLLTLSGVTLLSPHHAAQAAPLPAPNAPKPALAEYDDGDGDELLEHWGNPIYTQEERRQLAGMAGGVVLLAGFAFSRRLRRRSHNVGLTLHTVSETENVSEKRKAA